MNVLKDKYIWVLILIFITTVLGYIIPDNIVLAKSEIGVSLDKQDIEKGKTVVMAVDTNHPEIKAGTMEIYFDTTKLEYIDETKNSNFIENRVIYTWVDENFKERENAKTEKFKFKAIEDGIANIVVTGTFYDKDGKEINLEDGSIQVEIGKKTLITEDVENGNNEEKVSRDNTNLKALRLDKEGISPEFQKDIKEYYFIADNTINSLQITAIPENDNAQVTVTGNTNFKIGLNTIRIQVTSEDKTKKTEYKIYVTKTKNKELANANLENLAIREGMLYPPFDANITKYDIEVGNDITDLTILAVPERLKAKTIITGGNDLKVGNNAITVKVVAEDGITTKKYSITAHRRNNEEEAEAKKEQENQAQQLSSILDNKEEQNGENIIQNEKDVKEKDINHFVVAMIVLMIVFIIGLTIYIYLKRKNIDKNNK